MKTTTIHLVGLYLILTVIPFLNGCASGKDPFRLQHKTEMPFFNGATNYEILELRVLFQVGKDGSVQEAIILGTSGDERWDMAARDSLKRWRFRPIDKEWAGKWHLRPVKVYLNAVDIYNMPIFPISIIVNEVKDRNRAWEWYRYLQNTDVRTEVLETLIEHPRENMSTYMLHNVLPTDYPREKDHALRRLQIGDTTPPIRDKGRYLIFTRIQEEM